MTPGELAAAAIRAATGDRDARAELDAAGLTEAQRGELDRAANRVRGAAKRAAIRATGQGGHK